MTGNPPGSEPSSGSPPGEDGSRGGQPSTKSTKLRGWIPAILMFAIFPALFLVHAPVARFWIGVSYLPYFTLVTLVFRKSGKRISAGIFVVFMLVAWAVVAGPALILHFDDSATGVLRSIWILWGPVWLLLSALGVPFLFQETKPTDGPRQIVGRKVIGIVVLIAAAGVFWGILRPLALDTVDLQSQPTQAFEVRGIVTWVQRYGGHMPYQRFDVAGYNGYLESQPLYWDVKVGQPYQFVILPRRKVVLEVRSLYDLSRTAWADPWSRGGCGQDLNPAQRWALSCDAGLETLNQSPCQSFSGTGYFKDRGAALKYWWDIGDRADALKTLAWLRDQGHRSGYIRVAGLLNGPASGRRLIQAEGLLDVTTARRIALVKRVGQTLGPQGILAWDYVRLIWVAACCEAQGYISERDAWDWILPAARSIQQAYGSWGQMQAAYLAGREYWHPWQPDQPDMVAISKILLDPANTRSPFQRLVWKQNLGSTGPGRRSKAGS